MSKSTVYTFSDWGGKPFASYEEAMAKCRAVKAADKEAEMNYRLLTGHEPKTTITHAVVRVAGGYRVEQTVTQI